MATKMELRQSVGRFANRMEQRLQANAHKGGWMDEDPYWLMKRLLEEVGELQKALEKGHGWDREAADVANFAMMVSEVATERLYDRLFPKVEEGVRDGD